MSNDIIIEVKIKDEKPQYITGNLLLIYSDGIVIFANQRDMKGTRYPLSRMEAITVVGRYDKDGEECKHYAQRLSERLEKEGKENG